MSNPSLVDQLRSKLPRPGLRNFKLLLAVLLAAFCGPGLAPATNQAVEVRLDSQQVGASADSVTFADQAALEVAQLTEKVTPAAWLQSHPGEELKVFNGHSREPEEGGWCACATKREPLPDGQELVRHALFASPEAPSPAVLPPDGDPTQLIMTGCLLAAIRVETKEPEIDRGIKLASETRQAITRSFGPSYHEGDSHYAYDRWWDTAAHWRAGRITIDSSYRPDPNQAESRCVEVYAYLERSDVGIDSAETVEPGNEREIAGIQKAVTLGGLDRSQMAPLFSLLSEAQAWNEGRLPVPEDQEGSFVSTFEQWIANARGLDHRRQAAALVVADLILKKSEGGFQQLRGDQSAMRQRLAALGAEFKPSHDSYFYTNSWLKEALRLDPDGEVGESAFLLLMERGFDWPGTCDLDEEPFRQVIEEGEKYLSRATKPEMITAVHFLVADAYRDIVTRVRWAEDDEQASQYRAEAEQARLKAIQHYRLALSRDRTSPTAREAWGEAWRLMAGLPPRDARYFCLDGC